MVTIASNGCWGMGGEEGKDVDERKNGDRRVTQILFWGHDDRRKEKSDRRLGSADEKKKAAAG